MTRHAHRDERGAISLWMLGLCVMLLFVGGISLDLWRGFSERRALSAAADAAAIVGAQALDTDHFRATGEVALDPAAARQRAADTVAGYPDLGSATAMSVRATPNRVVVTIAGEVPLTLLAVLNPGHDTLPVVVHAIARPHANAAP